MYELVKLPVIVGAVIALVLLAVVIVVVMIRKRPVKLDVAKFTQRWRDLQKLCGKSETWPLAVINADSLLDEALKKRRCKGRTMGERLVSVQRLLSDNDGVWFGHKLRNRIAHEDVGKLKRNDVQAALRGFRQALKDLGALE